jgi:multidrug efflux pump subunit AcrB
MLGCHFTSSSTDEAQNIWIVRLALRRPYTIAVATLLILVLGALSLSRMIADIFSVVDIPVVVVVWNCLGLSPGIWNGE